MTEADCRALKQEAGRSIGGLEVRPDGICTALASMEPNAHLDVSALAVLLGRCKKSVQRAVRRGELPQPFIFLGRHVWLAGKIVEHLQERQDEALRQSERRAKKIDEQKRGI